MGTETGKEQTLEGVLEILRSEHAGIRKVMDAWWSSGCSEPVYSDENCGSDYDDDLNIALESLRDAVAAILLKLDERILEGQDKQKAVT